MDAAMLALLALAGLFAGFVDSIVGGGGVITLPALLATGMAPHAAVATNKIGGTGASSMATWRYARAGLLDPRLAWGLFPLSVAASVAGAHVVLQLPEAWVLGLVMGVIVGMVAYVLLRPSFGRGGAEHAVTPARLAAAAALALSVGFYDGVLGPGTGNLLLFGLVSIFGMGFLRAAAHGRVLNFGSNVGALGYFIAVDAVEWAPGLALAGGTLVGNTIGSCSDSS